LVIEYLQNPQVYQKYRRLFPSLFISYSLTGCQKSSIVSDLLLLFGADKKHFIGCTLILVVEEGKIAV